MGIFQDSNNNLVFPPKVGEVTTVEISGALQRVKNEGGENNYHDKNKRNLGYYDLLPVDGDKQLKINTWKFYFALKTVNPEIGDVIIVNHIKHGEYVITKL